MIIVRVKNRKTRRVRAKHAGARLNALRRKLGLSMRETQAETAKLARRQQNHALKCPISRLSAYEAQGVIPSIYALHAMSVVYKRPMRELLRWYGIRA